MKRLAVLSCALLVALPARTASALSFTVTATINPNPIARGGAESVTGYVTADTSGTYSVDVEIYNPSGVKQFEAAYDAIVFTAGQPKSFPSVWTVPSTAAYGTYSVQIGVFSANWNTQYAWNDTAGSFEVSSTAPTATSTGGTTATPTSAPTNTPTPTSTAGPTNTPTPTNTPVPPTATATTGGSGMIHIVGNQIVSPGGTELHLHGVNRSSFEYTCFDGSGDTHDGNADQAEINAMLAWNITAVRLPLNEDCWLGINGVTVGGAPYQVAVQSYVNLLVSNNIPVILNLHFNAPGTTKATGQKAMADRDHANDFWSSVATTFKNTSLVLYEPYNEPHIGNSSDTAAKWTCWRDGGTCSGVNFTVAGMQEMVTAIRNAGATQPIILTGLDWGSQVSQWATYKPTDPLNQLAVGWHSYGDGLSCQTLSCWNSTLAPLAANYPLVATEIGEFDCGHSYIDQVMSFLDGHGGHYQAWAWGPYSCSQDPALITSFNGTATNSYGSGFKTHLLSLP